MREYLARAIQWLPTWQRLKEIHKTLHFCALDESSLSIERVNRKCIPWSIRKYKQGFGPFNFHFRFSLAIYSARPTQYLIGCTVFWTKSDHDIKKTAMQFAVGFTSDFLLHRESLSPLHTSLVDRDRRCLCHLQLLRSLTYKHKYFSHLNPLTLRPAKTGLTNLEIYYLQRHFMENKWRRNVYQKPNYNSPSNILWTFSLFSSYFQKYESSRR